MSDPKRGGSRDISELKQRLGLKKATTPTPAGNGATGGLVPPPGLNLPPPPAPKPPNAADDPFGAMSAMVATTPRAPEIVIVNDGKPVEHVGASSRGASIAKIAVPAVAALVLGIGIGQLARGGNLYNTGIHEARTILGDDKAPPTAKNVKNVKKSLSELDGVLDDMKNKDYRPDAAADKKLFDLQGRLDINALTVFNTASALDPEVTGLIMRFYAGVAEVRGMLDTHLGAAKNDDQVLATGKAAAKAAAITEGENAGLAGIGAIRYAALVQVPTDTERVELGVKLVEIGQPYCGGSSPSTTGKCDKTDKSESPTGYAYRSEPGGSWKQGDLQTQGGDIPNKKLVLLLPTATRDALIKGGQAGASEVYYVKRLRIVADRTKKLIDEANKLEQRLQAESNKSSRFTFFL